MPILKYKDKNGKWRPLISEAGDAALEEDITSNTDCGAAPANTKFDEGLSFTEFAKKILIKEIAPTVTFSATNSGLKEVGTSVTSTMTLTVTAQGSASALTEVEFYVAGTLVNTAAYAGSNTFTYTHPTAITTNTDVKAILKYAKSDGSAATVTKTANYKFVKASYYGIAPATGAVTDVMVKAMTKDIRDVKGKTVTNITTNFERIVFAYPASFGNLTSIKDGNGFSNFDSYTRSTLSIDGENYNLYVLITPMTTTKATQIYA